jgi:carbon storage regulator
LVLTRKVGEKIWIGSDVCLTVVQVERGKVRLGFDAPRSVNIRREELADLPVEAGETSEEVVTCC